MCGGTGPLPQTPQQHQRFLVFFFLLSAVVVGCQKFNWYIVTSAFLFPGVGLSSTTQSMLSRPMQRKLVTLVHCQLVEEEGRVRAMRAARSLGERTVTELILQHQNPQQLSSNLWAAVRARGCQFLGPGICHLPGK